MRHSPSDALRILIVEDETIVALDMRCRLEGFGYQVCGLAASGPMAIQLADEHRPDLILMDIKLKGEMDGIEAAGHVRALFEVPIIFVTAFTDDETLKRVKASSSYGYIVKPYHERELKISIELALSKFEYECGILEAKATAEENDRAKSRFLSNISHELKTPLNAIIGFTDLAATIGQDVELKEYVMLAARSARKLESIINCILDYTKIESGALIPVHSEFGLEDFLLRCWEPFALEAHAKGLSTRFYLDPDLPGFIHSDASKLGTAVKSLVDNAVKFTDSGYVLLSAERVLLTRDGVDSMELMIRVMDSGRGIPDEKRQRIFDRFMQVDDSPTRAIGGLGLGLALVKGIADLLNMRLGLQESPEGGSEFLLAMGIPPDSRPAFQECHDVIQGMSIGLYGNCAASKEIHRWANRFCAVIHHLKTGWQEELGTDFACDAVFADVADWNRSTKAEQEQVLAVCGGNSGLTLLDMAIVAQDGDSRDQPFRLSYPLALCTLMERLTFIRQKGQPVPNRQCSLKVPGSHNSRPGQKAEGIQDSPYQRLLQDAVIEARQSDMTGVLDGFLAQLLLAASESNFSEAERIAKNNYDYFTESGTQACARFALALLMDTRRGDGLWREELSRLTETVHNRKPEA
ncbi:MAG: response regulator [Spirochaetia bacterium]|nr:response regulator [Spirochaetia bacterium]